jgi:hypothetical protein
MGGTNSGKTACTGMRDPGVDGSYETARAYWLSGPSAWDWNCDGSVTNDLCSKSLSGTCAEWFISIDSFSNHDLTTCKSDGGSGEFGQLCGKSTDEFSCDGSIYSEHAFICGDLTDSSPYCGLQYYKVPCTWTGTKCEHIGAGPITGPFTVGCD